MLVWLLAGANTVKKFAKVWGFGANSKPSWCEGFVKNPLANDKLVEVK